MSEQEEKELKVIVEEAIEPLIKDFERRMVAGQPLHEEIHLLAFRAFKAGSKFMKETFDEAVRKAM
jgi:hypothetical protein